MRYSLIILFLLAQAFSYADEKNFPSRIGKKAPEWELEDQFGKKFSSENYTGKNVIYILSDRSGNEFVKNWLTGLDDYRNRFSFVQIADLGSAPGFMKGFLRKIFRDKIPYSLLLDWDAELVEFYDGPSGEPTLAAVDAEGRIRLISAGKETKEEIGKFDEELKKIFGSGS